MTESEAQRCHTRDSYCKDKLVSSWQASRQHDVNSWVRKGVSEECQQVIEEGILLIKFAESFMKHVQNINSKSLSATIIGKTLGTVSYYSSSNYNNSWR